ncbi:MAG: tetratricopeptide repeat protein [Trichodesmium sp. MAG_R01]|nr:tetratricopeptide repeat protein [Trichodesmium sp. MAG_R01]
MNLYTLQELQIEWDKLRDDIQKESETEFNDQKNIEMLSGLLSKCIDAGQYIAEPGERANLQWIAREIGDTIFRIAKEYPDIIISSSFKNTEMPARSEMQNVYSVKENVNSLNRDSLFLQGSKPVNIETSCPNNLNSFCTGTTKFVGRDDVIKTLHEQLKVTEQVAITSITGMGGIGKTELALQYAHFHLRQKTYTGGICWLDCREKNVGLQIISFATSQFNLQIPKEEDLQTQIDFCWHNWAKGDVLIIFDDVVDYEGIAHCLPPPEFRFKVLITTRQKWLAQSFKSLELKVLDKDSALELLTSYAGTKRIEVERKEAQELCEDLGFLPLGLELVARYLERKPNLSLAKIRERLRLEHKSLERFSKDMTAQRGVAAAIESTWNELDRDSKELGCLLSLFASAPIPWDLVEKCLSDVDEEDLEDRRDEKLVNLSLLQSLGDNCYEFHPLIREFFRNKLSELDLVEEMKQNICRVIVGAAEKIPQNITVEQVKEVEIDIPHITEIADNLAEYLSDDDLITPFIRLGRFYKGQGLYLLAQPWLEKGKEIAEKRLDKNNSDIAIVYNNLAGLYKLQGKYEAAESLCLQAIEIDKIALPENHPSLATGLNNLAELYKSQGKYEAAEQLYLQAIEIHKVALPENHSERASGLNNLAELYREQGKYKAAEQLYLQAIEIDKIALPENHPSLVADLNNLALLYKSQGKYEAAEQLCLQAIEIKKIALPENHPSLAADLNDLAELYKSQGKYEAAEQLYLQAIEIHKIALPENHSERASGLNNLAELYRAQGKYKAAEQLYLQAIEIDKIALPENHPSLATDLNNLALLYRAQGKYEAAEQLYLQAIKIKKIAIPENHPSLATSLNNLASLYCVQGKYEAAEPLFLQVIEIFTQSLGEEHPNTQTVLINYLIFLNKKNESKQNKDKY